MHRTLLGQIQYVGLSIQNDKVKFSKCVIEHYFFYFSTKTYVVGTQKNRLNEGVLLSIQNTCLN